jgi:hypothetical protein
MYGERKKELDSGGSEAPRSSAKNLKSKARRKNPNGKIKSSGALKKSKDPKKGRFSRDLSQNAQIAKYDPIRKELVRMLKCLDALEQKYFLDGHSDIQLVLDYLDMLKWQCEIYMKYTQFKENANGIKKF